MNGEVDGGNEEAQMCSVRTSVQIRMLDPSQERQGQVIRPSREVREGEGGNNLVNDVHFQLVLSDSLVPSHT